MPPPPLVAELPLMVLLLIVSVAVPEKMAPLKMPPPKLLVELPLMVLLLIVRVALPELSPSLKMAPSLLEGARCRRTYRDRA